MKVRVTKKVSDGIVDIPIHTEYIKLQDFLKFCNAVESGGMAKNFIVNEEVEVNGETCTMENAEGKTHFLFCTELSPQLGDYDFDRSTLRFYDKDGNDITAEYNLSGGGIQ